MKMYDFGEKQSEYSAKLGREIPVVITPKYIEAKEKAINAIETGGYGLSESDFWILMNQTKTDKMAYTSLIISHNGCLKINDKLASPFVPSCVTVDKEGYDGSLVYTYCNHEQGIYEVGEISKSNYNKSAGGYPYAMAVKRCFDRVVLKLSKLAYSGIMSDSECDEFTQRYDTEVSPDAKLKTINAPTESKQPETPKPPVEPEVKCTKCGAAIHKAVGKDGKTYSPSEIAGRCKGMCKPCYEASKK